KGRLKSCARFTDVEAESATADAAPCLDKGLMKAMPIRASNSHARVGDDGDLLPAGRSGRHPSEDPPRRRRPELSAKEAHRMRCERVPEMNEHDRVLLGCGDGMIEGDRSAIAL